MKNIFDMFKEWLLDNYNNIGEWISINVIKTEQDNTSIMSQSSYIEKKYDDGSKEITLPITITFIKDYDTEQSDVNSKSMDEVVTFIEWLQQMDYEGIYPNLGDNITVNEMEVVDVPGVLVNTEENLARYDVSCTINYLKERN